MVNYKNDGTAQNVLRVKPKFKKKPYNCITDSYLPSVRMM